ncbi:hypothetical protein SAMN06265339_0305 [Desulfurobacterium pacificum]|uniref:Uncharacterized protein n=1 Tax=Desulfurobacterium pacificum TaxID=240166 RepID=A0ABY1NBS3_9BACT|nr:hypothetical protein [Desulfurobacterium pacificum]SMP05487.1 hypothetical protein SAMN06265339_0305 [Desulfurobacterium pacificum]
MDWGLVTAIVAAVFGFIGILIGIILGKAFSGGKKEVSEPANEVILSAVSSLTGKIENVLKELKEKAEHFNQQVISSIEEEINELISNLEKLKVEIEKVGVTEGSRKAIDSSIEMLKNFRISAPNFDNSLLTQIKDNLLIVRNDLQALMLSKREEQKAATVPVNFEKLISSIDSAIKLSKEINASLLKDELTVLADCLKKETLNSVLKDLDKQTLTAKEVALILTDVKKELEGVKK